MSFRFCFAVLFLAVPCPFANGSSDQPSSVLQKAERLSSLTGPGAEPFHLKLKVSEPANASSPYTATIEELWLSSSEWTRTVDSAAFHERVVVTGGELSDEVRGDYYPLWLRTFVTAAVNPLEDAAFWQQVSARIVQINVTNGQPSGSCARAQFKVGTPSLNNDAFAVICFNADGTLASVLRPGYGMEFRGARNFGKKRIATRYVTDPEPGTELVGEVDLLESLPSTGALPVPPSLPESTPVQIKSVRVNQEVFASFSASSMEITWPPVHSGHTSGKLSMYISADREGHIREAYPLNSDNAGLQDAARDQLLKWQLRPAADKAGERVQTEAALTFSFSTVMADRVESTGIPSAEPLSSTYKPVVISPAVSNSLRLKSYAPVYPRVLKERHLDGRVVLSAVIGRSGEVVSLTPVSSTDPGFTEAATAAVRQWTYKPYLLNGSAVEVETLITVNFQIR